MSVETKSGFNDESKTVEISSEDKFVGPRAHDLFTTKLIRPLPWDIKAGKIVITKKPGQFAIIEKIPGVPYVGDLLEREIITDGLEKEIISPELARVIALYKMVEDYLPDFMGRAVGMFRNNIGISASYNQWGREELQHSLAAGLILKKTGHKTLAQLHDEQEAGLLKTWEMPFPTARQMVIYAAFQERNTDLAYRELSKRAEREDAPITAKILKLISEDEAYHGGGYRAFAKIYHELDPEGTVRDALHVAENYRMPAQNLFPNPRRALVDTVKVYETAEKKGEEVIRDMVSEDTIAHTLRGFGFVSEEKAKEVADGYWSYQDSLKAK